MNQKKHTCLILDDEKNCTEVLAYEIKKVAPFVEIEMQMTDPMSALSYLQQNTVDMIFLDIEMPQLNAFQFLDKLSQLPNNIIFTTAYDHYAIKAFRYYAIDYLLKPIDRALLKAAIDRAVENSRNLDRAILDEIHWKIQSPNSVFTKIAVPIDQGFQLVNIDDIIRCEANINYATIHRKDGSSILISKPLKYLDNLLKDHGFFRTHQSHLVNINYIEKYSRQEGGIVILYDGQKIMISKSNKPAFEAILEKYNLRSR